MIDPELLKILCCPETKQPLKEADELQIKELNEKISAGNLKNKAGEILTEELDGGLIREDGQVIFPIRQEIPVLLVDESIILS